MKPKETPIKFTTHIVPTRTGVAVLYCDCPCSLKGMCSFRKTVADYILELARKGINAKEIIL